MLCDCELDTEPDDIRNEYHRQHAHESVPPAFEPHRLRYGVGYGSEVLVTDIIHAEQQGGQQGDNDDYHRTLQVVRIAYMTSPAGHRIRNEQERFKRIERRMQETELSALGERRFVFVYDFSQLFLHILSSAL